MGYSTNFNGQFDIDKPLTGEQSAYLHKFCTTRRMKRNADIAINIPDPIREAAALPIGTDGAYFVAGEGFHGQSADDSVIEMNSPPDGQPGLWCQWIPSEDNQAIEWDQGEKFYDYIEWIGYMIEHFFAPWGYVLNGEVEWEGEESGDLGLIVIENNVVTTKLGRVVYD
jgi:hypothetical protein